MINTEIYEKKIFKSFVPKVVYEPKIGAHVCIKTNGQMILGLGVISTSKRHKKSVGPYVMS